VRILLDGTVFEEPLTGVARVTLGLYEACRELDPSISIDLLHRRPLICDVPEGFSHRRSGRYLSHTAWRNYLLPLLLRPGPDRISHFPCNGNIPSVRSGLPVVVTLHDVIPLMMPDYFPDSTGELRYRKQTQADLDRADLVITVSEYSRNEILRNFNVSTEPLVIRPGLRPDSDVPEEGEVPVATDPYFVYVGGYDRRKGLEQLLRVFNDLVLQNRTEARLVLVGLPRPITGAFQDLLRRGLDSGRVTQSGYVTDRELTHLLRHARALVFPSRYEGFGLPALEAMAAGCPVITTRSTSLPEVCGEAAIYFDHRDDRGLAAAMVECESSGEIYRHYRVLGLARSQMFTRSEPARRFLDALEPLRRRTLQ
jgi:glycosyltransferase involved in cell wall biosynthesis